jgi:hypothetical protein
MNLGIKNKAENHRGPEIKTSTEFPVHNVRNSCPAKSLHIPTLLFFLLVTVILYIGWQIRDDKYLTAKSGLGYWFGIIGGVMMLVLALYPVRKKFRFMRNLSTTQRWFQVHWVLGIIGPTLILFHSNFHLGSLNSSLALFSTLLVMVSGLVGRYIYTKIHNNLYDRQVNFMNLRKMVENDTSNLTAVFNFDPMLKQQLKRFEEIVAMLEQHGFLYILVYQILFSIWVRWTHFTVMMDFRHALKMTAQREGWTKKEKRLRACDARCIIDMHRNHVLEIAEFNFYERLFALWHLFHFPLYILLVIVAITHVVAVSMY